MAKTRRYSGNEQTELLRTILITQLALAGVPQRQIRAIARCDMNTVTLIVKHLGTKAAKSGRRKE